MAKQYYLEEFQKYKDRPEADQYGFMLGSIKAIHESGRSVEQKLLEIGYVLDLLEWGEAKTDEQH